MPSASRQDEATMAEALRLPMCIRHSNCSTLHTTLPSHVSQMLSILWHDGAGMCIPGICCRINGAFLPVFFPVFLMYKHWNMTGGLCSRSAHKETNSPWHVSSCLPLGNQYQGSIPMIKLSLCRALTAFPANTTLSNTYSLLLFKKFIAPNVRHTMQRELSHSW